MFVLLIFKIIYFDLFVVVQKNKMLFQQKWTQLPILNIDFAAENKTQTQQTKHRVPGVFVLIFT